MSAPESRPSWRSLRASGRVSVRGFSQRTGSPAATAASISCGCVSVLEQMRTASSSPAISSEADPAASAPSSRAARSARRGSASQTAASRAPGRRRATSSACIRPIRPAPTTPRATSERFTGAGVEEVEAIGIDRDPGGSALLDLRQAVEPRDEQAVAGALPCHWGVEILPALAAKSVAVDAPAELGIGGHHGLAEGYEVLPRTDIGDQLGPERFGPDHVDGEGGVALVTARPDRGVLGANAE